MSADFSSLKTTVALYTPLAHNGEVDQGALETLVHHVLGAGLDGVLVLGSTGYGPSIPARERGRIRQSIRHQVGQQLLCLAGIMPLNAEDALDEIAQCAAQGYDGIVLTPPCYFPVGQDQVRRFYMQVADRTPLPLIIYNIPQFTKAPITPQTAAYLATHPNIAGLKDTSGDYTGLQAIVHACAALRSDFQIWTGVDSHILGALVAGATGSITGVANVVPQRVADLHRAYAAGDLSRAQTTQSFLSQLSLACAKVPFPTGWGLALSLLGIGSNPETNHPTTAEIEGLLQELQRE